MERKAPAVVQKNILLTFLFAFEHEIRMFPMVGVPFLEGGRGVKYSCPGRSRWDFLAVGEESPIQRSEGVGGSAFLERRRNLACVLLGGGSTDCSMCCACQSQMRTIYFVLFQKACILSAGWVVLGWGKHSTCCQDRRRVWRSSAGAQQLSELCPTVCC